MYMNISDMVYMYAMSMESMLCIVIIYVTHAFIKIVRVSICVYII